MHGNIVDYNKQTDNCIQGLLMLFGQPPWCGFGLSLQVLDGNLELSCFLGSFPLLWRCLHLQGWHNLFRENHFEMTSMQALTFPMLFLLGRGLMKQKWEPLGCTWSVTGFHTAHDSSSASLDDAKSHRVCDFKNCYLHLGRSACRAWSEEGSHDHC